MILHELLLFLVLAGDQAIADPCPGTTTREMEKCLEFCLTASQDILERVIDDVEALGGSAEFYAQLKKGNTAWAAFVDSDCRAVYDSAEGGSVRSIYALGCKIDHVQNRAHSLWSRHLRYDSKSPEIEPIFNCPTYGEEE